MRVSAKGEYATRAVLYLAMRHPNVATIHEIAACHHIPPKYLEQILLELKRGGILESRRGVHGGYSLSRGPAEISVGDVLRIVDCKIIQSSCDQRDDERGFVCKDYDACGLKHVWEDVQAAVDKILFETSFAEVCSHSRHKPPVTEPRKAVVRFDL